MALCSRRWGGANGGRVITSGARHLLAQRHLAVLICAAALLLKLLVPTGHMIDTRHGRIAIAICPGTAPSKMPIDIAMSSTHGDMQHHDAPKDREQTGMPCAFASLSAAVLAATDPIQLAALIAFVLGTGLVGRMLHTLVRPAHLRPPLRGPPAYP